METISVIIPAFNEEANIANSIAVAKKCSLVNEILVINNLSKDKTEQIALENGARVQECNFQGKGYAMEDGIKYAKNDVIVFIDADVKYEHQNIVEELARPIIENKADFVKSAFDRTVGGTVTEIVVKPLLNIIYPNMYKFTEPISGMIASRKSILQELTLEKDYGVDIGILLDVINKGYRVTELNIGKIINTSHDHKNNETMSKMSTEIIRAILKRTSILK